MKLSTAILVISFLIGIFAGYLVFYSDSEYNELEIICSNDVLDGHVYKADFIINNNNDVGAEDVELYVTIHEGDDDGTILATKTYNIDYIEPYGSEVVSCSIHLNRNVDEVTAVYSSEWIWSTTVVSPNP